MPVGLTFAMTKRTELRQIRCRRADWANRISTPPFCQTQLVMSNITEGFVRLRSRLGRTVGGRFRRSPGSPWTKRLRYPPTTAWLCCNLTSSASSPRGRRVGRAAGIEFCEWDPTTSWQKGDRPESQEKTLTRYRQRVMSHQGAPRRLLRVTSPIVNREVISGARRARAERRFARTRPGAYAPPRHALPQADDELTPVSGRVCQPWAG